MDRFEEIKKKDILLGTSALKWKKDMYVTHADYDWLISEIERLKEELEMSQKILENMTGGQNADEILNI